VSVAACVWGSVFAGQAFALMVGVHPVQTWQTNGRVNTIVVVGSTVYLGGQFTSVRPGGDPLGTGEVVRNHAAAFDLNTGALLPWNPNVGGNVRAIEPIGSTIYLGGSFTSVGGATHNRLAAVSASTGAVVATFTASMDAEVLGLASQNGVLFAGGSFLNVDGTARPHLAAVSATTGALTAWAPTADGDIKAMTMTADGTKLIVGGLFTHIGTSSQSHIAALSPATGATLAWASHLPYAAIDLFADPSGVFAAGAGNGGNFAAMSPATGKLLWQQGTDGNVQAITAVGGIVYAGGHFLNYCGQGPGSHICATPTPRNKLMAVDELTGALLPWNPGANSALGVFALAGVASNGDVLAGGDFTSIGLRKQQGYAQFVP
jgi:outer membrane protein assembly factor BamB